MNKYTHNEFSDILKGKSIDLFISSASFEDRCFVTANLAKDFKPKKSVFFYNKNEADIIIINSEKLTAAISHSYRISLNSDSPVYNYVKLLFFVNNELKNFQLPNILIDITTFTHETLLVLLRILEIKKHLLGNIFMSYVGASEYSFNTQNDDEKWLSKGIKDIRTIIGYSGFTVPTKKNHLIVLFGFESERTQKIIEQYEYDFISLGFANIDESIQNNHQKINCERHSNLLKENPKANKFNFSLVDPYQTEKDILNYLSLEKFRDLNTVIAPLNNKISTIGAGLAAIKNQNIQLSYAKPNIYNTEGYSKPNFDIYMHEITFDK